MSVDLSRFRCTECGDCCRSHRVPLTAFDLARLVEGSDAEAEEVVDWLAPEAVDMTGEPSSFVVLPEGRRLPVLAFRDAACRFLDAANRCGVYPSRPASCRTFPMESESGLRRAVVRLRVLEGARCPAEFDAPQDTSGILERLARRDAELARNLAIVARWNRRQKLRRWSGHRLETASSFLRYALGSARTLS